VPPVSRDGFYTRPANAAFGPEQPVWSYSAPVKEDFYSALLSGAQRLPNGNTLICSGVNGTLLEVTAENDVVWKYILPTGDESEPSVRRTPRGFGPLDGSPVLTGPPGGDAVFRALRYGPDYPGLAGKTLTPGKTIEESLRSGR
jgi:hypothetical protein